MEGGAASSGSSPKLEASSTPSYGAVSEAGLEAGQPRPAGTSPALGLPDLTQRLKDAGIYGEYHVYRQKYLQWRRGGAQGAVGELTATALVEASDPYKFEYWYPSASIFKWRFTTAYWTAILYLIGSFLFTFSAGVSYFHGPGGDKMRHWPNLVGAFCFTMAGYLLYAQLINVSTDVEDNVVYAIPDCALLRQQAVASSIVGTVSYFLGAVAFNVGAISIMVDDLEVRQKMYLYTLPNVVGSLGFVAGGLCEVIHNRMFRGGATIMEPVWWATMANLVGGVLFLCGSLPGVFLPHDTSEAKMSFVYFSFGVGSVLFIVSSVLMLIMWRANDFGLTLLKQLNFAIRAGGYIGLARAGGGRDREGQIGVRFHLPEAVSQDEDASEAAGFSIRGSFFIVVYCWFAAVAVINCICKHIWYEHALVPHLLQHALDLGMQVFVMSAILIVLVVHSVVTEIPDEEPYHCALVTSRFVLLCGALIQTAIMVTFLFAPMETYHNGKPFAG